MNIELTKKQAEIAKSFEASAKLNNSTIASYNLLLLRMQALLEKSRKNL